MRIPAECKDGDTVRQKLNEIIRYLRSIPQAPLQKRKMVRRSGGTGAAAGAFFTTYTNGDGHRYLQGGTVTGGNGGSETIDDEKVLDAITVVGTNSGNVLYLKANCTATVADGVMLPGLELNSASLVTGASVPSNHAFTVTSATGDIHFEIGRWNDDSFLPAGPPGNFAVGGCIGNYTLSKA